MSLGLTRAEAARLLREIGPNALPERERVSLARRLLGQLRNPLIYILLFALAFDLGTWLYEGAQGAPLEAIAIALILLLNAGLGVVQEYRSEHALARLAQLAAPRSWAFRDGELVHLPSAELVPGDVVRLEAGERVPADGTLAEARGFLVDESVLTGESVPVDKSEGDEALSGTLAARGTALLRVARTGARSSMGRLATLVGGLEATRTPLERRLETLGHRIARWVIALALLVVAAGVLGEGVAALDEVLLFAVALAVSAVPEGLPAVVTLTLALGVQRMARRRAVVRRLQAVEALGSVTVIATDKTGTLTENRMLVRGLEATDRAEALVAMVIANDADPGNEAGDPLERGLLEFARAEGCEPKRVRERRPRVGERSFDAAWKFMRVTVDGEDGRTSYLKGAPEVLLERSALDLEERTRWLRRADEQASEGLRVLALARAADEGETDLRFLGLVALWDPPRPEVPDAVRAAQQAGVRVLMVTGDHPATALAVARSLGIADAQGGVCAGSALDGLPQSELRALVARTSVFARVSPEHKLAIVEALQAEGEIVAVTGDGVNDAPALKRSDVGVAMGQRGSDVAREVADLVLLDDNFASIVAAIEEGRGIYANIQKFIRFLFSTNLSEILVVLAGTLGAWALGLREASGELLLPLTAVQILWVNFITDGPPALALGVDRNLGVLAHPPRPPQSPLLDALSTRFVVVTGSLKALLAGALLVGLPRLGMSLEATRTAVFLYVTLGQLVFAYPARSMEGAARRNLALDLAVVLGGGFQLLTVFVPALRELLGLVPLRGNELALVLGAVGATWLGAEIVSRALRSDAPAHPAPSPAA